MKTKRILKSLVCAALTGAMTLSMFSAMNVNAATNTKYIKGVPEESSINTKDFFDAPQNLPTGYASVPSSVDLSTSPCFPDIGDQGRLGSCSAFAATYYQYSYEVNKLNGVTSKNDRVIYSPKWTYNLVNNGIDSGSHLMEIYTILEGFGCLKNSDFPYTGNSYDYTEWPSGLEDQKIEALQTRVVNSSMYDINTGHTITNVNDTNLNIVKQLLNSGKVLTVTSRCNWNAAVQNGESIAFRCYKDNNISGGHSMTIVGYNDNKSYDVNGNGTIESYEKGAFKIANSWGASFDENFGIQSNTGYFWVMYDALNQTSANNINNWENKYSGIRESAFKFYNDTGNAFYYIDVAHKDVNLIGKFTVKTSDRENLSLKINRRGSNLWSTYGATELYPFNSYGNAIKSFNGRVYFDYDSFASPISRYYKGYYWFAHIAGYGLNDSFSLEIIDNLGKTVSANKALTKTNNETYAYHNINIKDYDVNYDGAVNTKDSAIIKEFILKHVDLSNLQKCLADCNGDGVVSAADASLLAKYIAMGLV